MNRPCVHRATHFALHLALALALIAPVRAADPVTLRGTILDAESGRPIPARLYIESEAGGFLLAESVGGIAIAYDKARESSIEIHTSLSAHPFEVQLPPGRYTLRAERGKEYLPATATLEVDEDTAEIRLELKRWIDMNALGWFSGETHVHRPLEDLRTLMLCEDLNVGLPLTAWVSKLEDTPLANNRNLGPLPAAALIEIDPTHVIWPLNTEYEIGSVAGKRHVLGALFVLNHKTPLDLPALPARSIAIAARRQGALLDLDKHNWPWSMMLAPAIQVDLFELTNNHLWRAPFRFKDFYIDYAPDYMELERDDEGFTERGWIDFGLQNYYALLNCGLDIKPSAGTASGVHPVPLGFGRAYVKIRGPFSYDAWIAGLREGRSFVTTGPMLMVQFDGKDPGSRFSEEAVPSGSLRISGTAAALHPMHAIEIVINGEVARTIPVAGGKTESGAFGTSFDTLVDLPGSAWVAVRVFEDRPDGRARFAHTAPVHVEIADSPLRPRRVEVEYLLGRVRDEIERHRGVLPPESLAEFRKAESFYQGLLEDAR
ncbi:MAG: CehA/McbA family metallohydrolase [Verrucomicrobiales bacterium]